MQSEFVLAELKEEVKTYTWENAQWPTDAVGRAAVLYKDKIVAIFDTTFWAERFVKGSEMPFKIMRVVE